VRVRERSLLLRLRQPVYHVTGLLCARCRRVLLLLLLLLLP
jgi:hypothetical protein